MISSKGLPHPDVPEWKSECTASSDGEFASWDTVDDRGPYEIAHNRDVMMDSGVLVQDYNFLTYRFGDEAASIEARIYLDNPYQVGVIPAAAGDAVPDWVLLYLKKRFHQIDVLGEEGYETVWIAGGVA